ncbi:Gfo/Idh/MocA family oxidoreductase [Planctomycetota bacterium]|nr:Gfo/Idh/MocA family oxidoreductase [Planctomycetota bacterium]
MNRVGVIGLGMMGLTHLDAWSRRDDVLVTAIADQDTARLSGEAVAEANLEGLAETSFDYDRVKKHTDAYDLINDSAIDIVDICLPTHLHLIFTKAAIDAGKHVLVEKPLARNYHDAMQIVELASTTDKIVMPAQCMRFWPGWSWLKDIVDNKKYGNVLSANFKRMGGHPKGAFYENGDLNGGGLLDIHIHDTDFVQFLFGIPSSVSSKGYKYHTNCVDHVITTYDYDSVPIVIAEGGWWPVDNCPFHMSYTVVFDDAVAMFDISKGSFVTVIERGDKEPRDIEMSNALGYDNEIAYFINCVKNNMQPKIVTTEEAANTILIAEAERDSVESGKPISLKK